MNLQNNSFTGTLDPLVCNISNVRADCGVTTLLPDDSFGSIIVSSTTTRSNKTSFTNNNSNSTEHASQVQLPEITCSCCSECCNDVTGCPYDTGYMACERDRDAFTPEFCTCMSEIKYPYPTFDYFDPCNNRNDDDVYVYDVDDYTGIRYNKTVLTCNVPYLKYCNSNKEDCTFRDYGRIYSDVDSTWIGEQKHYYYYDEASIYYGMSVDYSENYVSSRCAVFVNGIPCDFCDFLTCQDGHSTITVQCSATTTTAAAGIDEDRVAAVVPPASYHGCLDSEGDPNIGILQVLLPVYDSENYLAYNPEYCEFAIEFFGNTGRYNCTCPEEESGLTLRCLRNTCSYCYSTNSNSTTEDNNNVEESNEYNEYDCFVTTEIYNFQKDTMDVISDGYEYQYFPSPPPIQNVQNTTSTFGSSAINATTTTNPSPPPLVTFLRDYVTGACTVLINEEQCERCELTFCESDGSSKYQINCENIIEYPYAFDGCYNETVAAAAAADNSSTAMDGNAKTSEATTSSSSSSPPAVGILKMFETWPECTPYSVLNLVFRF